MTKPGYEGASLKEKKSPQRGRKKKWEKKKSKSGRERRHRGKKEQSRRRIGSEARLGKRSDGIRRNWLNRRGG